MPSQRQYVSVPAAGPCSVAMWTAQEGDPPRPGMIVETDVGVIGVRGLEGRSVKAHLGVVLYLAVPQSHQEVGDIDGAPSGLHVVGLGVDGVVAAIWKDGFGCPFEIVIGTTAGLVGGSDVETISNPLDDVTAQVLGPAVADWTRPQPEATPPAPITGTQPT